MSRFRPFRIGTIAAFACVLSVSLLAPRIAAADSDWVPGKYMGQAMIRVMASARRITEKTKYGLDDASTCFDGAYIEEGKQVSTRIPLEGGKTYAFIGGGDDDVTDLDLYLIDDDGDVVAKDDAKDSNPVVVFTPKESGKYKVVMKLVSTKDKGSFCCYSTMREGGFDVPVDNMSAAWARMLRLCERINDKLGPTSFHSGDGELCLLGSLMSEGQSLTQSNVHLDDRSYAFVATADDRAEDIDLAVLDSDGSALARDVEKDATPIVLYTKGGTVTVKLSDPKSKGTTLCLAAFIRMPKAK